MSDIDAIRSCLDVGEEQIAEALAAARSLSDASPREKCIALLRRMAKVAKPRAGAPRMLGLLAQMAKRDWLEGDLIVRLIGDRELAVLELLVEDGVSRERIVGPLRIDVPLDEFLAAISENTVAVLPLRVLEASPRRLELRGTRDLRTQHRKASISAFSPDLSRHIRRSEPPPPPRPPPPPSRTKPARKESLASFEKASPVLEIPDELRGLDAKQKKR